MKVALVTTTFYKNPDDVRFQLALKTCAAAVTAGYPLHIVDGSPDPQIRNMFEESGAVVAQQKTAGMGASRRQCLNMGLATEADVIVWLEPEKAPFVPLIPPCAEMILRGYNIVIPGRKSLESYPRYQELSELRAMRNIGIMTGRPDIDWMFGPRVLSRRGAQRLADYTGPTPEDDTWHILVIPVLQELTLDTSRVGSRLVDYTHPPEQTAAEEGDQLMDKKRDHQREVLETAVRFAVKSFSIRSLV